jgi:uncharacterized protein YecT (DUF1311 family)
MKLIYIIVGSINFCIAASAYGQFLPPKEKSSPSFSCQDAKTQIEKWICKDPALGTADSEMAAAYNDLKSRSDDASSLYSSQIKWLEERNRCQDAKCVALAYQLRNTVLTRELDTDKDLGAFSWATLPPNYIKRINAINDTYTLRFNIPAYAKHQKLNLEFYPDPNDYRMVFDEGPYAEILCTPPDAKEGYASYFNFHKRNSGLTIAPIKREGKHGYLLMHMTIGKELPLNAEIKCYFGFSSWLLDKPSILYMVPVAD